MDTFLIDTGTKKLEVQKRGTGAPVIIIETGMGVSIYDWHEIICALENTATVIAYHRPGYGQSSPIAEGERTISDITGDLQQLLEALNIREPFILAAHSFGGFCAQHFAVWYPHRIAGMVLIGNKRKHRGRRNSLITAPADISRVQETK